MSQTIPSTNRRVRPSVVTPGSREPFAMEQELKPFGRWVDKSIWVPPQDAHEEMARTMLKQHKSLRGQEKQLWTSVVTRHKSDFTRVREIELPRASIRLPKGRFFVTITERKDFQKITDDIPACVRTRLDEFLNGPGKQPGVRVYYLKPLCVEVGDELILTTREELFAAIEQIKQEVFGEYRRRYAYGLPGRIAARAIEWTLAVPKTISSTYVRRRRKVIDAYHAKLEFQRRKTAMHAAQEHQSCFTTGCSFDEMLALTNEPAREDVIRLYAEEHGLSKAERERLLQVAVGALPWFVTFTMATTYAASVALAATSPVVVCDPAFVAEMPGSRGVLLKIGHFDEVAGVTHVEI